MDNGRVHGQKCQAWRLGEKSKSFSSLYGQEVFRFSDSNCISKDPYYIHEVINVNPMKRWINIKIMVNRWKSTLPKMLGLESGREKSKSFSSLYDQPRARRFQGMPVATNILKDLLLDSQSYYG